MYAFASTANDYKHAAFLRLSSQFVRHATDQHCPRHYDRARASGGGVMATSFEFEQNTSTHVVRFGFEILSMAA